MERMEFQANRLRESAVRWLRDGEVYLSVSAKASKAIKYNPESKPMDKIR